MVGNFTGRNGHNYKVEFSGDGVNDKTISFTEVTITMNAHERKFVGYKSTSAKVSVLTDSPLLDLYAEGVRDIAVTITDVTEEKVIFYGYVVPFTFEQPFTGRADAVTIDCVDAITATKEVKYMSLNDEENYGVDETAEDIIRSIFSIAGMTKLPCSIVCHSTYGGYPLPSVKVAQAGFLQDEMTALEAINAIFLFLGYTAVMVGYELHLYDEHCLLHSSARLNTISQYQEVDGKRQWVTKNAEPMRDLTLDAGEMRRSITLSVERAYGGIQLKLSGSDTSVLCPDVCAKDNIEKNTDGRGTERVLLSGNLDGKEYWEFRMPVQSKVMDMGISNGSSFTDWTSQEQVKATGDYAWRNGAMMIVGQHFNIGRREGTYLGGQKYKYVYPTGGDERVLLWLRAYDSGKTVASQNYLRYSHTGGWVILNYKFSVVREDWKDYTKTIQRDGEGIIRFLPILMGDKYYWKDYDNDATVEYSETHKGFFFEFDSSPLPTWTAAANYMDKVIIPVPQDSAGKQISVGLSWWAQQNALDVLKKDDDGYLHPVTEPTDGIFIEQIELLGYGDAVWEGHADMRHKYENIADEMMEVEVGLSTRASGQGDNPEKAIGVIGLNARPGVVAGDTFPGAYASTGDNKMPLCGVIMEQLKARYGEPHERLTMTMEGTGYLPSDIITFNGVKYTVEGYEIDLLDSTTQLIID